MSGRRHTRPSLWAAGRLALALILAAAVARCAAPPAPKAATDGDAITFAGEIPCADCPGIRVTLTLFRDGSFRMRETYREAEQGTDRDAFTLGRWSRPPEESGKLVLRQGAEAARRLRFTSPDHLRLLDLEGNDIVSELNYDLARQEEPDRLAGPMPLRGMYTFMADAASFHECRTDGTFPVVPGPLGVEIERAYAEAIEAPGSPVLASLTGRFELKEPEPGAPPREHLVIEALERFHPRQTCAREALVASPLIDTYWKAVEIEGQPVRLAPEQREPHLLLVEKGSRAAGATGCNRFTGSFHQASERLSFTQPLALTRMACPPPADSLERSFLAALEATATHRVEGETLELLDADGRVVILFESRHLR